MSGSTLTRRRYTLLLRKLTLQHNLLFFSIANNTGDVKSLKATSQCLLNEEIPITIYDDGNNAGANLYIMHTVMGEEIEIGVVGFDLKSQKIMKPLSKQFFSKQLANKSGYIEYKFIAVEVKNVTQQQYTKYGKIKNDLMLRIQQHKFDREEVANLMSLINEKDQVIGKMEVQIQRLIRETKKLNKSLSKEKAYAQQQVERNINLNVKFNPSTNPNMNKSTKNINWEREKEQYEEEIQRLSRKIRDLESKDRSHRQQMDIMRRKMQLNVRDNEKKISDLRKQIAQRYEIEAAKEKDRRLTTEQKQSQGDIEQEREKKNRYIEEQLAQQLKKIEIQKERELKRDIERELKIQIEKQNQRQKDRERERIKDKQRETTRQRERSKVFLRESSADHREFMKQINQLEEQKRILKDKITVKDEQLHNMVIKLERAQKEITKLEDQNIQLRKTKSSLLREVDEINFKSQPEKSKGNLPQIEEYEKMIINERKQMFDQKLRAELDELRVKIKKLERENKDKIQEKDMEIMKLRLSEKSAIRQKEIYSTRIKQMMENVQGDRKNFLQALQNAHKFESQQTRTKQLEVANNQLQTNNYKLTKQKQQMQNNMKKLKSKIDEREGQWIRLKSIEAQHDYYKNQCEKFEKAFKKFEKQYDSIKEYCQNLEHIVGKKPRKTFDDDINTEREERYKTEVRNRLEVLIQEVKDMENKFYLEQIELWLTERTNVAQYYAKKFEQDKGRILDMDNINEQAKTNLIEQKQKQIQALKQQEMTDVDRKINKLKALIRNDEQKLVANMIDKATFEQISGELAEKIEKLRLEEENRKKELVQLKEKNTKLETQLREKNVRVNKLQFEHQQRSLSLYPDEKDPTKVEDTKKSLIEQFKKSRDFYMSKPFDQLKKLNAELQTEKRKVETQMNSIKFNFDKERVQLNDKIRTKERQLKKLEHEIAKNQKASAKQNSDIEGLRAAKDELQVLIRKLRQQLKQVSRTLELKERQCSEALSQIKRMEKNLIAYEQAQKKMFEDVKKMKDKLQKKQLEIEAVMQERNLKSKQIDAERINTISKLQQKSKQLQFKLQKQISENLTLKNENQKLAQTITEYQVKLRDKQSQYQVLDEAFNIYKTEWGDKVQEYEEQNNLLQNNIMQIANQMEKKESEACELQIKIEYSEKREEVLQNIKNQLQEQNKQLKDVIETLKTQKSRQSDKFNDQVKAFDQLKDRIDDYIQENARLQLTIKENQQLVKDYENGMHEAEKQLIRAECDKKNLQTEIFYVKENFQSKIKQLENIVTQKEMEIQKIQKDKSRVSIQDKARKSSEHLEQLPASPNMQKKLLGGTTTIQRSNSLIQGPTKSSKNIGNSSLVRKNSAREQQQNDQLYFSKQGIQVNVKKPPAPQEQNPSPNFIIQEIITKSRMPLPKKQSGGGQESSKVDIDLDSEEQGPKESQIESVVEKKEEIIPMKKIDRSVSWIKNPGENQLDQSEEVINQQNQEHQRDEEPHHDQNYEQRLQQLEQMVFDLTNEKNQLLQQLKQYKSANKFEASMIQHDRNDRNQIQRTNTNMNQLFLNRSIEPSYLRKTDVKQTPPQKSSADIVTEIDRLNKKLEESERQCEEMRNKVVNYELALTENEGELRELREGIEEAKLGEEKLIGELQDTMKLLQEQVTKNKTLKAEIKSLQQSLTHRIQQLQAQLEQTLSQSLKKDQTITQTLSLIQNLNNQLKDQQHIIQSLQTQTSKLGINLEKTNKLVSSNRNQYRKYEEDAELQILRLKEKVDQMKVELKGKDQDIQELAERYTELEDKIQQLNSQLNSRQTQILTERSKLKQAIQRRDQALEQMRKFQSIRTSIHNRIGDLEQKLSQKTQQLKQLTKEMAIGYKKYEIQLSTVRQQQEMEKKKLREREEHISNLKLEMANYNEKCYELERERNGLAGELSKLEKQLREIMVSYQQELDQLHKDKVTLAKQIELYVNNNKDNQLKMQAINKELSRKTREIKQLSFKLEQQQSHSQKIKQKSRKQINTLIANLEVKNDQYHKIKVQLERETQHYFTKEVEYLADKEKKDRMEREYTEKLENYEKVLKGLEEELKEVQNRPSSEQWEEICFQNQLYKNRIEQLETLVNQGSQQQEQRLISQFKRYKISKQKQIEDLQTEMQKYSSKFHNLQEGIYVLKKDNDSMKIQLRTVMQEKMRMQKSIKEYEEDIRELKTEVSFYKAKRADDLNKLLNETYD